MLAIGAIVPVLAQTSPGVSQNANLNNNNVNAQSNNPTLTNSGGSANILGANFNSASQSADAHQNAIILGLGQQGPAGPAGSCQYTSRAHSVPNNLQVVPNNGGQFCTTAPPSG